MAYISEVVQSDALVTASETIAIGSIDISHYDKFALTLKNQTSSTVVCRVDLGLPDPYLGSAGSIDFVSANTAIVAYPSSITTSQVVMTSAISNVYKYMRVALHTTATNTTATVKLIIGGHRRLN